ncbi:unnamed protein product [Amoebophrya sp. A25]|nr:unnamed protein product [Amoebophrya sp. A25]|eukprot:GSA25T00020701001.1
MNWSGVAYSMNWCEKAVHDFDTVLTAVDGDSAALCVHSTSREHQDISRRAACDSPRAYRTNCSTAVGKACCCRIACTTPDQSIRIACGQYLMDWSGVVWGSDVQDYPEGSAVAHAVEKIGFSFFTED